ncbi:A/G-specific adenine glycosylase [Lacinutrix salivirga]
MNFTKIIINWYSKNKRDLPWRQTKNPYYIWLSEIILQQTQVAQGTPYYHKFVSEYPTVYDLANAQEQEVLKLWQGLGYYSRARNLHATAQHIVTNLEGNFPDNYKQLLTLKGVGDYTASAIASISFNEPTAVVDGNVYRILSRYYGIKTPINTTSGFKEFKALAQSLMDTKQPATFNQAIMEFGARQCKPKSPDCDSCPLNTSCVALKNNLVGDLPVKLKKTTVKKKYFNYIVFLNESDQTILEQRKGKGIWQNLYQFPLIESKTSFSVSDIENELSKLEYLTNALYEVSLYNEVEIIHKLSHQHLYTKFWIVTTTTNLPKGISVKKIESYPVPILISNFIKAFNF